MGEVYQRTLLHPHTPNQWLAEVQRTPQYKRSAYLCRGIVVDTKINCHIMTEHFETGPEERYQ